jgi:rfaE bifunctional protein kinase chain/domain
MTPERLHAITSRYSGLRIAIIGDFCLDRYFEIDLARQEISIETGLPVHNITNVRCQPGAAGTILNNLVALGVARLLPVGFCGEDGEGYELRRALDRKEGVETGSFIQTPLRRTFTYTKPLVVEQGKAPMELSRLDIKNWTPTPVEVEHRIREAFLRLAAEVDAIILMDQVDIPETGVVTRSLLAAIDEYVASHSGPLIIADSRRGLKGYPKVTFKMNAAELAALTGRTGLLDVPTVKTLASALAGEQQRNVFVTMAEKGIVGATPEGAVHHAPALPVWGELDIVGAGDSVTANLTAALAAGATIPEALELSMLAASLVIHQLGTTGTASISQLSQLMRTIRPNTN